jgi:hypothetical protein
LDGQGEACSLSDRRKPDVERRGAPVAFCRSVFGLDAGAPLR